MKKFFGLFLATLFLGCGPAKIVETDPSNVPSGPDGVKGKVIGPKAEAVSDSVPLSKKTGVNKSAFSAASGVGNMITFLASDQLKGRAAGGEGIEKAASAIEHTFEENRVSPYFSTYKDTLSNFSGLAYNVVGYLEGNDNHLKNQFVVIGAHYDHIGITKPVGQDSIANGANDNASGTTTVLELARYFARKKSNKRSVIFALFSAEEQGLLGSTHLAKKLKTQAIDLYTMLNFEMVGVPLKNKDYFMYISGYEKSNMAEVANQYAGDKLIGFLPTAAQMNLFQRSDNYPFHLEFNVPSQTFCTFDFTNFDHYHQVGDEADIMDFEHMAEVVNRVIPVVEGIVNSPVKEIKYH
ncbi:MAG: M28 family metallopeptidase [Aurantibacter sp.]